MPVGAVGSGTDRGRFGQADLIGNVWEWVRDDFDPAFYSKTEASGASPIRVNAGGGGILRGASWFGTDPITTTSFNRASFARDANNSTVGIRCARD